MTSAEAIPRSAGVMRAGFLGLGAIGAPIASRLAGPGDPLVVFDVRREPLVAFGEAGEIARSAKEVGDRAELVFGCLASEDAHRDALLGPQGLIHGGKVRIYVNLGTIGASLVREIEAALQRRGIATLDAPVTGGVGRARSGTLTAIVSGAERTFAQVADRMRAYASEIVWLGPDVGAAQIMKVVNNAVSFANLAAACEALVVGAKAGLDPQAMLKVVNSGSGQNSATLMKIPSDVLTGAFNFGGSLRIVIKDLKAFIDEAERLGVTPSIGRSVLDAFTTAAALVSDAGDVTEVVRPMENAAGVKLRQARPVETADARGSR